MELYFGKGPYTLIKKGIILERVPEGYRALANKQKIYILLIGAI